jgi:hypothetical protein
MLNRRRINLPPPENCAAKVSECAEITLLNELDGFNLMPRISIPFDGEIDLNTVKGSIFFAPVGAELASVNVR